MKAVLLMKAGGAENLVLKEIEKLITDNYLFS